MRKEQKSRSKVVLVVPSPTDKVLIDGVELTVESSQRALRTALTSRGLSTSGAKQKCFKRLLEFQEEDRA